MRSGALSEISQMAPSGNPSHLTLEPGLPPHPSPPWDQSLISDFTVTQFIKLVLLVFISEIFKICRAYFIPSWSSCSVRQEDKEEGVAWVGGCLPELWSPVVLPDRLLRGWG